MSERRKRLRIKYHSPVVITRYNGVKIQSQAMNLSNEGLALKLNKPLVSGEIVQLQLELGQANEPVLLRAEVAYNVSVTAPTPAYQVGLKFHELSAAEVDVLDEYIYSRAQSIAPQPIESALPFGKK